MINPQTQLALHSAQIRLKAALPECEHAKVINIMDAVRDEFAQGFYTQRIVAQNPQTHADKGKAL